jgi:hypothetical protein
VFHEGIGADEWAVQADLVGDIEEDVIDETGQEKAAEGVKEAEEPDGEKAFSGVKDTDAQVGDVLQVPVHLAEIGKHPLDAQAATPLKMENQVVKVNENASRRKEGDFTGAGKRDEEGGCTAGYQQVALEIHDKLRGN